MKAQETLRLIKAMRAQIAEMEKTGQQTSTELNEIIGELSKMNICVYGNKGRMATNTACITSLDEWKGQCNPRLATNWCQISNIGCPHCMALLERMVGENDVDKYEDLEVLKTEPLKLGSEMVEIEMNNDQKTPLEKALWVIEELGRIHDDVCFYDKEIAEIKEAVRLEKSK